MVGRALLFVAFIALFASWLVAPPQARALPSEERNPSTSETITFGSRTVELTLSHSAGGPAWDSRVKRLVVAAGPVLEDLIGVPYPGPEKIGINERTGSQLGGYAGLAGCSHVVCNIRLSTDFRDKTLLHELTHAWTQSFRNRWLAEGMAEYISERASTHLDGRELPVIEPAHDRPPFPLLDWLLTIDFNTAEEEQIQSEYEGYYWSERFFEQLEATIGADALERALAVVVPLPAGTVGVRRFMDALDEVGASNADDLFLRYVFPEDSASNVLARRSARDRFAALGAKAAAEAPELAHSVFVRVSEDISAWEFERALAALDGLDKGLSAYLQIRDRLPGLKNAAEAAGLAYPYPLQNALQTWDFGPFVDTIDRAGPSIEAYVSAKEKVVKPRNAWQRLGLIGQKPEDELRRAEQQFAAGRFTESIERSEAAEAQLNGAGSRASNFVLIVGVILAVMLAGALVVWRWKPRREPSTHSV
jgi:hypothetical protein